MKPLRKLKRRKRPKLYEKDLPGERIQMDTCKIDRGIFQYTAIDDFSRFLVADIYSCRNAANTLNFIEPVIDSFTSYPDIADR